MVTIRYPRADVDVFEIRHKRHRLACLRTDMAELNLEIERGLHKFHETFGKTTVEQQH